VDEIRRDRRQRPEMVVELRRIEQIVDENFEQIAEEEWK